MRILENGVYRDATEEETLEAESRVDEVSEGITDTERIEALEAAILELAEVVLNG